MLSLRDYNTNHIDKADKKKQHWQQNGCNFNLCFGVIPNISRQSWFASKATVLAKRSRFTLNLWSNRSYFMMP